MRGINDEEEIYGNLMSFLLARGLFETNVITE